MSEPVAKLRVKRVRVAPAPEATAEPPQATKKDKKLKGQFYTVQNDYILADLDPPPPNATRLIEPFAGKGDLIDWYKRQPASTLPVEAYDIDPKSPTIQQRDTLRNPPDYSDAWVLTNPPYLARNKCEDKTIFDLYNTNDLYKAFIHSLAASVKPAAGGILIIPAGFFLSPRDIDVRCREAFLSRYRILKVKYFEEDVFPDTPTTVVAISFVCQPAGAKPQEQEMEWIKMPAAEKKTFRVLKANDWIIGGEIYHLAAAPDIKIRRHVVGVPLKEGEQLTALTLSALDSGKENGRICLQYREGYTYPAIDTSRSYATLCIQGRRLTAAEQTTIAQRFNEFVEKKRGETWSLFLPQYRESKEYARKRIPFELAYLIVLHLIGHGI
jgi:hypothetical protein